jgi:hypothetical protein
MPWATWTAASVTVAADDEEIGLLAGREHPGELRDPARARGHGCRGLDGLECAHAALHGELHSVVHPAELAVERASIAADDQARVHAVREEAPEDPELHLIVALEGVAAPLFHGRESLVLALGPELHEGVIAARLEGEAHEGSLCQDAFGHSSAAR